MGTSYAYAPDVEKVARPLIAKHHNRLGNVEIVYVTRRPGRKAQGELVLGAAKIVSGLNAFLVEGDSASGEPVEPFFVIEVAGDYWERMEDAEREALIDHQLSHCDFDTADNGSRRLFIAQHDVEDFTGVVRRHGLWQRGLRKFAEAIVQLELPLEAFEDPAEPEPGEGGSVTPITKGAE